jgi:hypothetical protein
MNYKKLKVEVRQMVVDFKFDNEEIVFFVIPYKLGKSFRVKEGKTFSFGYIPRKGKMEAVINFKHEKAVPIENVFYKKEDADVRATALTKQLTGYLES